MKIFGQVPFNREKLIAMSVDQISRYFTIFIFIRFFSNGNISQSSENLNLCVKYSS